MGREVPASCFPPEVAPELLPYLHAFWLLSTTRGVSFGGPLEIPWTAIDQYAQRNGFADDDIDYDTFVEVIHGLDRFFLTHIQKKQSAKKPKGGKP